MPTIQSPTPLNKQGGLVPFEGFNRLWDQRGWSSSSLAATILDETETETNSLPVFVRPMAKSGFKNKTGMRLPDWQDLALNLAKDNAPIPSNLVQRLNALAKYYSEAPQETASFTKDEATLKMVSETARARLTIIETLISSIQ